MVIFVVDQLLESFFNDIIHTDPGGYHAFVSLEPPWSGDVVSTNQSSEQKQKANAKKLTFSEQLDGLDVVCSGIYHGKLDDDVLEQGREDWNLHL